MIRRADAGDVGSVAALERTAFDRDAWSDSQIASDIARSEHAVVVAESGGTLLGYAAIAIAGDVADLTRIVVMESVRRRGVAAELLAALVTEAAQQGAERMLLEVAAANIGARDFYQFCGFTEISRRRNYYADGDDAVVMCRALG